MIVHTAALVAFISFASSGVDAHGTLGGNLHEATGSHYAGDYYACVDPKVLPPINGGRYDNYPDDSLNAAAFGEAFEASSYTDLAEFILKNQDLSKGFPSPLPKSRDCGFSDPTKGPVKQLPDKLHWWGGGMIHHGPCYAQCGKTPVMKTVYDCKKEFPDGIIPYEKEKCANETRLTFYWMATIAEWQVYTNCIKIGEGGPPADFDNGAPPPNGPPNNAPPPNQPGGPPNNAPPASQPGGPPSSDDVQQQGEVGGKANVPQCKRKKVV